MSFLFSKEKFSVDSLSVTQSSKVVNYPAISQRRKGASWNLVEVFCMSFLRFIYCSGDLFLDFKEVEHEEWCPGQ